MGKIDMVPFLGEFNYYMPYVILVPTLITLFNVFAKMFAICSISDNFFDNDDDEGGIGGDLEEGVQVLKDGKHYSFFSMIVTTHINNYVPNIFLFVIVQ